MLLSKKSMSPYTKNDEEVYEGWTLAVKMITGLFLSLSDGMGTCRVYLWGEGRDLH